MGKKSKKKKGYVAVPEEVLFHLYQQATRDSHEQMSKEAFETFYENYRQVYLDDVIAEAEADKKAKKKAEKAAKKAEKKAKKELKAKDVPVEDDWDANKVAAIYAENFAGNQIARRLEDAEKLLKQPGLLQDLLERAEAHLHSLQIMQMNLRLKQNNTMKPGTVAAVQQIVEQAPVLLEMVRSYANGTFTDFSEDGLVGIVASLLYFESDEDTMPDTIPGIGYLDDVSVLKLAERVSEQDKANYIAWKEAKEAYKAETNTENTEELCEAATIPFIAE